MPAIPPTTLIAQLALALLEAQEEERSRLAEELHDGPAQALANAIFQTEILERAIREDTPEANQVAQTELFSLRQILDRELEILRGYINQLRPSLDEAEGVEEALRDSAAGIHQRSGLPIEVSLEASSAELPDCRAHGRAARRPGGAAQHRQALRRQSRLGQHQDNRRSRTESGNGNWR